MIYLLSLLFVLTFCHLPTLAADSSVARPIKDKWALVIGVGKFEDKSIPELKFASKDAKDFSEFLVSKGNFKKDHVLILLNENATYDNIRSAIGDDWLPKRALEDDLVVVFFSSHGSPKELDIGNDNFLVAYDTNKAKLFSTGIRLKDLAHTIKDRTGCDRIVLLIDACNSGAAQAGGKGLYRAGNFNIESVVGEGQIVISSSRSNQRSWESKRYENGVFTHYLMSVLSDLGPKRSLEDAFEPLKDRVQQEVRFDRKQNQIPVMRSKWKGPKVALLAPPTNPRTIPQALKNQHSYSQAKSEPKTKPQPKTTPVVQQNTKIQKSPSSNATSIKNTKIYTFRVKDVLESNSKFLADEKRIKKEEDSIHKLIESVNIKYKEAKENGVSKNNLVILRKSYQEEIDAAVGDYKKRLLQIDKAYRILFVQAVADEASSRGVPKSRIKEATKYKGESIDITNSIIRRTSELAPKFRWADGSYQ